MGHANIKKKKELPMEKEDFYKKFRRLGIQERLEAVPLDDVYYKYGILIGEGKLPLDPDAVNDISKIHKLVAQHWTEKHKTFDW